MTMSNRIGAIGALWHAFLELDRLVGEAVCCLGADVCAPQQGQYQSYEGVRDLEALHGPGQHRPLHAVICLCQVVEDGVDGFVVLVGIFQCVQESG
jgi:hypothetical protein